MCPVRKWSLMKMMKLLLIYSPLSWRLCKSLHTLDVSFFSVSLCLSVIHVNFLIKLNFLIPSQVAILWYTVSIYIFLVARELDTCILVLPRYIEISYVICHGSLCHNINICHDMKCFYVTLPTIEYKTFFLLKCVYRWPTP